MTSDTKKDKSNNIYNRKVYILIDQGSGMDKVDLGVSFSRWELLAENVQGDINNMMRERAGQNVCDQVSIYLFSRNRVGRKFIFDKHSNFRMCIIAENLPDTNRFISISMESCLRDWQQLSQKNTYLHGTFIIIYTSGIFSDFHKFKEKVLEINDKFCDSDSIKIILIGVGEDFKKSSVISQLLELYFSQKTSYVFFFDSTSNMTGIIDLLETSINSNTGGFIPKWVEDIHGNLCRQYSRYNCSQDDVVISKKQEPNKCPRCGSTKYIKNGHLFNKNHKKKQRLKCKDCGKNYLKKY